MSRSVALIVLVATLLVASALPPEVDAKLRPAFGQRTASVGDTVRFHLGAGASLIRPPIHLHLVSINRPSRSLKRSDPNAIEVAFIDSRLTERRRYVDIEVPNVPAGEYTIAIWFRGYATDEWLNGAAGFQPLLTITEAQEPSLLDAVVAPGAIILVVLLKWRPPTCRPSAQSLGGLEADIAAADLVPSATRRRQDASW